MLFHAQSWNVASVCKTKTTAKMNITDSKLGKNSIGDYKHLAGIDAIYPKEKDRATSNAKAADAYFFCKRILDLSIILLALPFLLPIIGLIMIAIMIDSPGSAFYTQERIKGVRRRRNGKVVWKQESFTMYKFRTMQTGASTDLHQEFVAAYIAGDEEAMANIRQAEADNESKYKLVADPRVTRIGNILRKTSLDELPQLWNVLNGDMSLVGPRPALPYEAELYEPWHYQRLATMQGLTGAWQTEGRSNLTFDEMVQLDLDYIRNQSLLLDIKILLKTIPAVLQSRGAG